jgi:hypothetical protein
MLFGHNRQSRFELILALGTRNDDFKPEFN